MTECESGKSELSRGTWDNCVENKSRAFRLRPVNTTERFSKKYRYLKSSLLKIVAWIGLAVAVGFTLAQVSFLSCSSEKDSYIQASLVGLVLGCIYIFAASVTFVALREPVYFWLHTAMALNIIAAVGALASEPLLHVPLELSSQPDKTEGVIHRELHEFSPSDLASFSRWCNGVTGILAVILAIACGRPVFSGHRDISFRSRHIRD